MLKWCGILIALLILVSTAAAVEEEKIVSVDVQITVDKTINDNNETIIKVKAESNQNSYEFTLDKDTASKSENKTFMTIKKMQCETEGIVNLTTTLAEMNTKLYNEQCADVEGISYKWRWEGVIENYKRCQDELLNTTAENKDCQNKLIEKDSQLNNRISAYSILETEKTKAANNAIWYFIAGIALISGIWYFKTRKDKPDNGPTKEGFTPFQG